MGRAGCDEVGEHWEETTLPSVLVHVRRREEEQMEKNEVVYR